MKKMIFLVKNFTFSSKTLLKLYFTRISIKYTYHEKNFYYREF